MKVSVGTLGGTRFEIEVKPEDTVADVKKNIEAIQGDVYPAARQMLVHRGTFLNDGTTVEENKVDENSFIVVMLKKAQQSSVPAVTTQVRSVTQSSAAQALAPPQPAATTPGSEPIGVSFPSVTAGSEANIFDQVASTLFQGDNLKAAILCAVSHHPGIGARNVVTPLGWQSLDFLRNYDQFKRLLARVQNNPQMMQPLLQELGEQNPQLFRLIQEHLGEFQCLVNAPQEGDRNEILNVGGALPQAIQLTPEEQEAVGHLETMGFARELVSEEGIPQSTENVTSPSRASGNEPVTTPSTAQPPQAAPPSTVSSGGPNAIPLNLFPQDVPNEAYSVVGRRFLDILRNHNGFPKIRAWVQNNPQTLQPFLQDLRERKPQFFRLIQEHMREFLLLFFQPQEGEDMNEIASLLHGEAMPQEIQLTPEEEEAVGRLEAMGFGRALVLEAFIRCNKNEELAANYLLDHRHEDDED